MKALSGRIVTPTGVITGRIVFDELIEAIEPQNLPEDAPWVLPGFVDLHVHGGGGADCMEGAEAVRQMAGFHAAHGTTTLLPTTMTDSIGRIGSAFDGIAKAMASPSHGMARIAGVHLEGPFINSDALGAQPPMTLPPDQHLVREWHAKAPIAVATIAPEIDEAGLLLAAFQAMHTKVQIGHSMASYAQASVALDMGYAGFTHLFNAMTGMHHRRPGIAGCALERGHHAEIIADLLHVSPAVMRVALKAIPEVYAITDAGAAAGMPDGSYKLGAHQVLKSGEKVVMPDRKTIAGSALTMDRALRNLVSLGINVAEASRRCSGIQADYLELPDRGWIEAGRKADLVVMSDALELSSVWIGGQLAAGG